MSSKKCKLALAVCLSLGKLTAVTQTSFAEQTTTSFVKNEIINGSSPSFRDDLKKGKVWDSATKTYIFTKDSTFSQKFRGVDAIAADINIKADGVNLTFDKIKSNMPIRAVKGSELNLKWHEWKADKVAEPVGNINITAKKLIVNVDETAKTTNLETFAIGASSYRANDTVAKVNIKGDVKLNVKNNYWTDNHQDHETFTGGIAAVNASEVTIAGNAKIRVEIPNQGVRGTYHFVGHYFVNGICAGLNYFPEKQGPKVHITGDVDIDGDGTDVQANSRSTITIDGGGKIVTKDTKEFQHFAVVPEESTVNINAKLDKQENLSGSNRHKRRY